MRRQLSTIALVILLTGSAACSAADRIATPQTAPGGKASTGITRIEPQARQPAPRLVGTDLNGAPLDSADFADKILVVNIWGSWCAPCRKETPSLVEVARSTQDQGIQFLGVAIREGAATSRAFARKYGVPYPSFSNPGADLLLGFSTSAPAVAVPMTYVIDRKGRVAAVVLDTVTESTLTALIDDVSEAP